MQGNVQNHLHKRSFHPNKDLQAYPHPNPRLRYLDKAVVFVAAIGPMANIPQIIQIYASKDAGGLSFATWGLFFLMNLLWITYGGIHREKAILFGSISTAIFQAPIIIGILIY